jgi:dipeptidyl aminopeptidase/acylaminoacyl peptidase
VFSTRVSSHDFLSRGIKDARLLSVSSKDEMALLLHPQQVTAVLHRGTLAVAPVAGGTPREVLENVLDADWSPDGRELALVRVTEDGNTQIQFPKGHLLYAPRPPHWISMLRVSPRGDRIAFFEHPTEGDMRGDLRLVDLQGRVTTLAADYANEDGLAWSAGGSDVEVSARRSGTLGQLIRVSRDGRERVAVRVPGDLELLDVSQAGDRLVSRGTNWMETRARGRGAREETELAAGDVSALADLSDDGTRVLGTDIGEGSGPNSAYYVQATDGSAPVWLGEGDASALSPDGRFALVRLVHTSPEQLQIVPTGPGDTRVLAPGPVVQYRRAVWDPSGRRIVFSGIEREGGVRLYVQDVSGGLPRAVTPAGVSLFEMGRPVSPDGTRVVALGPEDVVALFPLAGGEPVAVPRLTGTDVPLCFTPDSRELFVAHYAVTPPRVERVEIASGRARPWTGMGRSRPSGLQGEYRLLVTPDGASYAYSYNRKMSDLYLVTGVR